MFAGCPDHHMGPNAAIDADPARSEDDAVGPDDCAIANLHSGINHGCGMDDWSLAHDWSQAGMSRLPNREVAIMDDLMLVSQ